MELIEKNKNLIDKLVNDLSLISSKIKNITIYELNSDVMIDVDLILSYSKSFKKVRLKFINVIEYSFYHNSDYIFYNVETLKFFKEDNIYISFDPDEQNELKSAEDNDFILSEEVEGYFII